MLSVFVCWGISGAGARTPVLIDLGSSWEGREGDSMATCPIFCLGYISETRVRSQKNAYLLWRQVLGKSICSMNGIEFFGDVSTSMFQNNP
jgi:hypothetical protein